MGDQEGPERREPNNHPPELNLNMLLNPNYWNRLGDRLKTVITQVSTSAARHVAQALNEFNICDDQTDREDQQPVFNPPAPVQIVQIQPQNPNPHHEPELHGALDIQIAQYRTERARMHRNQVRDEQAQLVVAPNPVPVSVQWSNDPPQSVVDTSPSAIPSQARELLAEATALGLYPVKLISTHNQSAIPRQVCKPAARSTSVLGTLAQPLQVIEHQSQFSESVMQQLFDDSPKPVSILSPFAQPFQPRNNLPQFSEAHHSSPKSSQLCEIQSQLNQVGELLAQLDQVDNELAQLDRVGELLEQVNQVDKLPEQSIQVAIEPEQLIQVDEVQSQLNQVGELLAQLNQVDNELAQLDRVDNELAQLNRVDELPEQSIQVAIEPEQVNQVVNEPEQSIQVDEVQSQLNQVAIEPEQLIQVAIEPEQLNQVDNELAQLNRVDDDLAQLNRVDDESSQSIQVDKIQSQSIQVDNEPEQLNQVDDEPSQSVSSQDSSAIPFIPSKWAAQLVFEQSISIPLSKQTRVPPIRGIFAQLQTIDEDDDLSLPATQLSDPPESNRQKRYRQRSAAFDQIRSRSPIESLHSTQQDNHRPATSRRRSISSPPRLDDDSDDTASLSSTVDSDTQGCRTRSRSKSTETQSWLSIGSEMKDKQENVMWGYEYRLEASFKLATNNLQTLHDIVAEKNYSKLFPHQCPFVKCFAKYNNKGKYRYDEHVKKHEDESKLRPHEQVCPECGFRMEGNHVNEHYHYHHGLVPDNKYNFISSSEQADALCRMKVWKNSVQEVFFSTRLPMTISKKLKDQWLGNKSAFLKKNNKENVASKSSAPKQKKKISSPPKQKKKK